jgi:hypothetical protein
MSETIATAYNLPFEVRLSPGRVLSSGGPVCLVCTLSSQRQADLSAITEIIELFIGLATTGAMAGHEIEPWKCELELRAPLSFVGHVIRLEFSSCRLDERALIVLTNLFLARRDTLVLRSVEVFIPKSPPALTLRYDPDLSYTLPDAYAKPPFLLNDEKPESGAYTLTAELAAPLLAKHQQYLDGALRKWTETVRAGGYELAPVPPSNSWVEPAYDAVIVFDNSFEWGILKLRADPDCINGLVNIFSAFHHRCQALVSLTIS